MGEVTALRVGDGTAVALQRSPFGPMGFSNRAEY